MGKRNKKKGRGKGSRQQVDSVTKACICTHWEDEHDDLGRCHGHMADGTLCPCEDFLDEMEIDNAVRGLDDPDRVPTLDELGLPDPNPKGATTVTPAASSTTTKPSTAGYTGNSSYGSYGTTTSYKPKCYHTGTIPLFEIGTRVFGGGNSVGCQYHYPDYLIDLAGSAATSLAHPFVKAAPKELKEALEPLVKIPQVIRLDWDDYGVPPVGYKFWRVLLDHIPTEKLITVCCTGGHGRTGTCLASFLVIAGVSANQAMRYIRRAHCPRAIESVSQEKYLRALAAETAKMGVEKQDISLFALVAASSTKKAKK